MVALRPKVRSGFWYAVLYALHRYGTGALGAKRVHFWFGP
jgi:hypothetical protein